MAVKKNKSDQMDRVIALSFELSDMIERALLGQRESVELAVCCYFAGGHLLIEDVPGVGKTTLARALARATGGEFRRIQFTADLLPTDITGVGIWKAGAERFEFQPGPVFGNVVLADEINRATAKTQSALLEAMSERSVTVDGVPHDLPTPFTVIATQNRQEHHGTYPLPESQLDRFLMRISLGYPDSDAERAIVARPTLDDPVDDVTPIFGPEAWATISQAVDAVHVDETVLDYLMALVKQTRRSDLLTLGVGPRGGMALHRASRALALLRRRDYVLAKDVKDLLIPVLAHRVVPAGGAWELGQGGDTAARALLEIAGRVEVPL